MSNRTVKVIVADDSAFMRLLITDIISSDSRIQVVDTANDGKEALEKVSVLKPDVLILDMNMGEYDGLYAVEHIMKKFPIPILILSSMGNSDLLPIFEALRLGAVDYINKPDKGSSKIRNIGEELIQKIINVSNSNPRIQKRVKSKLIHKKEKDTENSKRKYDIIVIGASTGGPSAIEQIISLLPDSVSVPIIICQHMPSNFIQPFVNRLNNLCGLNILVGQKGMVPQPGMVIVAPGDTNMVLKHNENIGLNEIDFSDTKYSEYNNPSINAVMLSAAKCYGKKAIGVILTGMGKDGTKGLKAIKESGGYTIAQNEESCIIYGMPKIAIETNSVDKILDIREISKYLLSKI